MVSKVVEAYPENLALKDTLVMSEMLALMDGMGKKLEINFLRTSL